MGRVSRSGFTLLIIVTAVVGGAGAWSVVDATPPPPPTRRPTRDLRVELAEPSGLEPSPWSGREQPVVKGTVAPISTAREAARDQQAPPGNWIEVLARAVQRDGTPVAGAEVTLSATFFTDERGQRLPLDQVKAAYDADRDVEQESEVVATVTAGPGGQVRFAPLEVPPGAAYLHLMFFDPASGAWGGASVEQDDGAVDLGDVVASTGAYPGDRRFRLHVQVVRRGEPAAGAVVTAAWYWDDPEWERVRADALGRVTLIVPPTDLDVTADTPGEVAWRDHVLVDERDVEVTLELASASTITGVVLDAAGAPVPDAIVDAAAIGDVRSRWGGAQAVTGVDGRFSLQRLGAGPHVVAAVKSCVSGPTLVSEPRQVDPGDHAVLIIDTSSTLRLPADREGLHVERRAPDGRWRPISDLSRSGWAHDSITVPPGSYRLIDMWSLASSEERWVEPGRAERLHLQVGERVGRRVTGRVVRQDGSPVPGARVCALNVDALMLAQDRSESRRSGERAGAFLLWIPDRALTLRIDVGAPSPTTIPLPAGGDLHLGDIVVSPP